MATCVNYCEVFKKDFNQKSSFALSPIGKFSLIPREKFCQIKRFCIHNSLFTLQVSTNYFKANTFCCQSLIREKNLYFFPSNVRTLNLLLKKYVHLFFLARLSPEYIILCVFSCQTLCLICKTMVFLSIYPPSRFTNISIKRKKQESLFDHHVHSYFTDRVKHSDLFWFKNVLCFEVTTVSNDDFGFCAK